MLLYEGTDSDQWLKKHDLERRGMNRIVNVAAPTAGLLAGLKLAGVTEGAATVKTKALEPGTEQGQAWRSGCP